MALFTKSFKTFMMKGTYFRGRKNSKFSEEKRPFKGKEESKGKNIVCFECRKSGHIKFDCPLLKKSGGRFEKKKIVLKA